MLPPSHIVYTLTALQFAQRKLGLFRDADYRLVALGSIMPDLLDKPLAAAYFYKHQRAALLYAHTLIANLAVLLITLWRFPHKLVYALAYISHGIEDRLWYFPQTLYWPLRGWQFHRWTGRGSEHNAMQNAYITAFTRRPEIIIYEAGALLAGLWFLLSNKLYQPTRLLYFLKTGKLPMNIK